MINPKPKPKPKIKLQRRTLLNDTHSNIIDDSIETIETFSINPKKFLLVFLGYILTGGLLFIIRLIFPKLLIILAGEINSPLNSQYVIVKTRNGETFLLYMEILDLYKKNKIFSNKNFPPLSTEEMSKSHFMGKERNNNRMFKFRDNTYIYSEQDNTFFPLSFSLQGLTNKEVHDIFGKGDMTFENYHYQLNKFGLNTIKVKTTGCFGLFIKHFFSLPILYNYFSVVILVLNEVYSFSIFIIILTTGELILEILFERKYSFKIFTINPTKVVHVKRNFDSTILTKLKVKNKNKSSNVLIEEGDEKANQDNVISKFYKSKYLVPGDLILLTEDDTIVPCDGLILDGSCWTDERLLNGEAKLKVSFSIPFDNTPFSFVINKKSILFQGSKIEKCQSSDKKKQEITVLVLNTANNTYRNTLMQNYELLRPGNFRFVEDFTLIIVILAFFWFGSIIYSGFASKISYENVKYTSYMLTIIISPCLSICYHFCCIFFHFKLQKRKIECIANEKLLASGGIDTLIVDRAGLLTEEELELYGFQSLTSENTFDKPFHDQKYFKTLFTHFWNTQLSENYDRQKKEMIDIDYQTNNKYIGVFFTECLACCNYINKVVDGKFSGNDIDILIYNLFSWEQEIQKGEKLNDPNRMFLSPKNSYKIIDEDISSISVPYKLEYIKRYQFSLQIQIQSVIVKNSLDNSCRLYIKGGVDQIIKRCNEKTIPSNYDELFKYHTQKGLLLIACATKVLTEDEVNEIKREDNYDKFGYEMRFLGFIIFKNSPMIDTKNNIAEIEQAGTTIILATVENPYSARRIALECGIIKKEEDKLFLIDYKEDENTGEFKFVIDLKQNTEEEDSEKNESKQIEENDENTKLNRNMYNRHYGSKDVDVHLANSLVSKMDLAFNIHRPKELEISNEDLERIKGEKDAILCLNGTALLKICQYSHEISDLSKKQDNKKIELVSLVKQRAKIFYRLNQNDKKFLLELLRDDKRSIVAMMGEASCEGSTLMSADISISLNQTEGNINILTNFASTRNSIACVKDIMKIGRACFENNIILIKYICLIGLARLIMILKFINEKTQLTTNQSLFLDIFCVFIPVALFSTTGANYNLCQKATQSSLISKNFIISFLGELLLMISSQLFFILYFPRICPFSTEGSIFQSCMFLVTVFQYISLLASFNMYSTHRKSIFVNKLFMLYFPFLILYSSSLITIKEFKDYSYGYLLINFGDEDDDLEEEIELAKMVTLLFSLGIFIISFCYEFLVRKIISS